MVGALEVHVERMTKTCASMQRGIDEQSKYAQGGYVTMGNMCAREHTTREKVRVTGASSYESIIKTDVI